MSLSPNMEVFLDTGYTHIKVRDLQKKLKSGADIVVLSCGVGSRHLCYSKVIEANTVASSSVYRVSLKNGVFVECTSEQLLLSPVGTWNSVKDLMEHPDWDVQTLYGPATIDSITSTGRMSTCQIKTENSMLILSSGIIIKE